MANQFRGDSLVAICPNKQGRYAILGRQSISSPWVMVENILGYDNAKDYSENLCTDSDLEDAYLTPLDDDWALEGPLVMPASFDCEV